MDNYTFVNTIITEMATKTTSAQTFMVDVNAGAKIQLLLAQAKINGKVKYKSISDFVNQAIQEKLRKEGIK